MPRKSDRRERILDIATSSFLIEGYDSVTVDELCKLTNSTKGSFYHFFASKENLAIDVVNSVWHETQQQLLTGFSSQGNPAQKLLGEINRVAGGYYKREGRRHFVGCPICTLAVNLKGKSPRATRRLSFALTHMNQFYQAAFAEVDEDTAADNADSFQIGLAGLTTLGKATSSAARIRTMTAQLARSIPA